MPSRLKFLFAFLLFLPLGAISAPEYDLLPAPDKNGNWGYVTAATGKVAIPAQYYDAGFFGDGLAIVKRRSGNQRFSGLIDRAGNIVLPLDYDAVSRARPDYGAKAIWPGVFLVEKDGQEGVFRMDGQWLLPLGKYERIRFYDEGYFSFDGSFWIDGQVYKAPSGYKITRVRKDAGVFMIETASRQALSPPKKGVMLWNGEMLIRPEYDEVNLVEGSEPRWLVSKIDGGIFGKVVKAVVTGGDLDIDDKKDMLTFSLLDEQGREIRKYRARYHPFTKDGRVSYESGGKQYRINPADGELLPEDVSQRAGGKYVIFRERGFWGVKDTDGNVLIEPQYLGMGSLGGDLFSARFIEGLDTSGKAPEFNVYALNVGVVDASNRVVMPFEYREIRSLGYPDKERAPFMVGGYAETGNGRDVRYGMTDRTGKIMVPFQFLNGFYMNSIGQATVYADGRNGVIDHTGKFVLPMVYKTIFDTSRLDKTEDVFYVVEKDRLWGVCDATGKEIVPRMYGYLSVGEKTIRKGWVVGEDPDRKYRGAYNYMTKVTILPKYDGVRVHDSLIVTYRSSRGSGSGDEYDLLDFRGKKIATFQRVEPLPGGSFMVRLGNRWGVMDAKGKVKIPPRYEYMSAAEGGLLLAGHDWNRRFFVTEDGREYRMTP